MNKGTVFDLLRENALADNDCLGSHDREGDVFSIPRDVDFAFKTPEKQRAEDLREFINGMNYAKTHVRDGNGLYWVVAIIHMPITQYLLCAVSGFMVCVSRLFQVEYDGWGSVIQKEKTDK